MKKKNLIIISLLLLNSLMSYSQSVAINEDGTMADPSALLDIKSTAKGLLIPRMTSADRTGIANPAVGLLVYDSETGSFWYNKAAGWTELIAGGPATNFWDTDGTHIYNTNTGYVGIGTNNPTSKLTLQTPLNTTGFTHIGGADEIIYGEGIGGVSAAIGTVTNHAFRLNAGGAGRVSIYPAGEVVVGSNATGAFGKLTVQTLNSSYGISHLGEGGNVLATFMGGTSAGIGTFSNTNMRIFSNGASAIFIGSGTNNVGIGVDFPTYKMEVAGRMRLQSESAGVTAGLWLNNPANTAPIAFMGIADNVTAGLYGNVSGWGLIMNTNTGNIGIGTLNPTYKLSVNGDIRTKEVVVETGWADYVFDKKYRLMPLDEVEKFIQQNNHLPNIPSAREVKEKGLYLGNIQKRMMEKIEELTLYVIELKKEMEALKKE